MNLSQDGPVGGFLPRPTTQGQDHSAGLMSHVDSYLGKRPGKKTAKQNSNAPTRHSNNSYSKNQGAMQRIFSGSATATNVPVAR